MSFMKQVLEPPSYGYVREGKLYVPTAREMFAEYRSRMNLFATRKNWLPVFTQVLTMLLGVPFVVFLLYFFSWKLVVLGFFYSMVGMGSHGTVYLHRYSTHRAFRFRNKWWRMLCSNLVLKIVPEEVYVISHHVHHKFSEQPGDPYNVNAGGLYCFLADVNHQLLARNLTEREYEMAKRLLNHCDVPLNSYAQYQRWGSLSRVGPTIARHLLNWAFWYGAFYLIGGHALAVGLFASAAVWGVGIRTFNYAGHGAGKDRRKEGIDFNRADLSVNQIWPGFVAGEWHNNHHLYPNGSRAGFLPYQIDIPWYFIRTVSLLGGVVSFKDYKTDFHRDHYGPYLARVKSAERPPLTAQPRLSSRRSSLHE